MKKVIGFLALILSFTACSDGDVKVQNISFEDITTVNTCNDNYFKIKGTEMLLFRIVDLANPPFPNKITATNTPRIYNINSTNKVVYRNYSGSPTTANICDAFPPASPSVIEEWTAIGGTIQVTTTAIYSPQDATTHATRITGYSHFIVFKNLIFQKPTGTQAYGDDFRFGYYTTTSSLSFLSGNQSFISCNGTAIPVTKIYYQNNAEGVVLSNLDSSLITNNIGTRTANIGISNNVFAVKTFNANLPQSFFCNATQPATPTQLTMWSPDLTASPATIEVTTTRSLGTYTHKIHIKNMTLKNDFTTPVSFYLADDYYLGDLITN